ncbi:hypothetical protein HZA97_07945 [Candidatus Woesearchaeota archaeon]|nr:hypothetical protein [Candidatus Woesearchaeota archaeon]
MKKQSRYLQVSIILIALLLTFNSVSASHNDDEEPPDKGFFGNIFDDLTDAITAIPEMLLDLFLDIINAPIRPLLSFIKTLLGEPPSTSIFKSIWSIVVYIFSFCFSLILVFCGFSFILSGHDVEKREKAKDWLKNTLILIILLPASYFIYELILQFSAGLTNFVLNIIRPEFFLITSNNLGDIFLSLALSIPYLIVLLLTGIVLVIRYALISAGVIFFPIGIFFYFISPLKSYGSFIINFLMINIFIGFINALFLLAFSKLVELPVFSTLKILVMISAFLIIDLITIFAMVFALIKAAVNFGKTVVNPVVKIVKP